MKLLLLLLLAVVGGNVVAASLESRRHRVPLRALLRAQFGALKRVLGVVVWGLILVPVVVQLSGYATPLDGDNLRTIVGYYILCVALLWVVSAWPFRSRPGATQASKPPSDTSR
jgi:hypothetical protein